MDKRQAMQQHSDSLASDAMGVVQEGGTMQRVQTQYQTAVMVQKPRELEQLAKAAVKEFQMGGELMYYSWRQKDKRSRAEDGKSTIEGIGVHGAKVLMRVWGNCAVDAWVEADGRKAWVFKAVFIDLEQGVSFPRMYNKHKDGKSANYTDQRATDINFSDGQQRCMRNAILDGVPIWLQHKCLAAAKGRATEETSQELEQRTAAVVKEYEKLGVTLQMLENNLDSRQPWTAEQVQQLIDLGRAIKDGQAKVEEVFGEPQDREPGQEG
jgi:hypothetical protein